MIHFYSTDPCQWTRRLCGFYSGALHLKRIEESLGKIVGYVKIGVHGVGMGLLHLLLPQIDFEKG